MISSESYANIIFSPKRIGALELPNRLIMAPMAVHLAPITGELPDDAKHYFLERAKGGVALIMLPSTGWARIDAAPPSVSYQRVPFYEEARTEDHKRLVEVLKEAGAKVGIQLNHRGRQATRKPFGYRPVAPSPVPWSQRAEVPESLSIPEIENLVERYGKAGAKAKNAGFDLVEIHAAHGYLISNFLSPDSNRREDKYGGEVEQRAKFLLDVVECVRNEVGKDFPISVRINGSDFTQAGIGIEESTKVARLLERSEVDLISVSAGVNGSYPLTIAPFYTEKACFLHLSEEIKKAVQTPVAVAGRMDEKDLAQAALGEQKADFIAIGRGLLADPQLPVKWRENREESVTRCLACNTCIDAYWKGEGGCLVNPAMGREKTLELKQAGRSKVIWVIGSGLAGLEASWRASARGHCVSLFEERREPGGQWILASKPPGKEHFRSLLDDLSRRVKESGVRTFFGKKIESQEILEGNPDAVILATGAEPPAIRIPGLPPREQVSAWDILKGALPQGENFLVVGGGAVGLEVAHFLASKGKRVSVFEMKEELGAEMGDTVRWTLLRKLKEQGVALYTLVEVRSADADHLYVVERGIEKKWKKFDMHVLATGLRPRKELGEKLKDFKGEVHLIGDAKVCRRGADAVREGAIIGTCI